MSNLGACNRCEEPPCVAPVLEFISVQASCDVCGYALPAHDDLGTGEECLRFATRTDVYTDERILIGDTSTPGYTLDQTNQSSQTDVRSKTQNEAGACVENYVSGAYSKLEELFNVQDGVGTVDDFVYSESATAGSDGVFTGTWTYTDNLDAGNNDSGASVGLAPASPLAPDNTWAYTSPGIYVNSFTSGGADYLDTLTFSAPVTTCEPVLPAWPAWEGDSEAALITGQGYATSALRAAGGTCGLTITLRSVKWRVKHQPSGTCYLKAWIRKTFTPATGSPTTSESTYEWTGTGNPCLADPALAVDHEDNRIYGSATEETAPETAGVVTWEILKFSCVSGYEPDISDPENPQPNGFPDPTWEAAPP